MWILKNQLAWTLPLIAFLGGGTSTELLARRDLAAVQPCTECNIVEEGIWNENLINTTVYGYSQDTHRFYPVTVTAVYREGPYRVLDWYDPVSGRRGHDDATRYYSYRNMQNIRARGNQPDPSQVETQERNGWLASCAMALRGRASHNLAEQWIGERGCCESTAARRYGPNHAVCG